MRAVREWAFFIIASGERGGRSFRADIVTSPAPPGRSVYIPILRLIIVTNHFRFCHSFVVKYDRILFLNQYILALICMGVLQGCAKCFDVKKCRSTYL